jgi:hypothetical protein
MDEIQEKGNMEALYESIVETPCLISVYIDASAVERKADFVGFPVHANYSPRILVSTNAGPGPNNYGLNLDSVKNPNEALVRSEVRIQGLEKAIELAQRISDSGTDLVLVENGLRVNDLPVDDARKLLELYRVERGKIDAQPMEYM